MKLIVLRFQLRSAATFGRSDGVAGLVDRETEHDELGLPYLRGKTLKGLLAEECESIVFALERMGKSDWCKDKEAMFGTSGSTHAERGILHIGDAQLPAGITTLVQAEVDAAHITPDAILASVSSIRRQSAMNEYGAPQRKALRAMRVVLNQTWFEAVLTTERELVERESALLAAAVLALRHVGTARNRGRGWLRAELDSPARTQELFNQFKHEVEA